MSLLSYKSELLWELLITESLGVNPCENLGGQNESNKSITEVRAIVKLQLNFRTKS